MKKIIYFLLILSTATHAQNRYTVKTGASLLLTTSGSNGVSTYSSGVLNIPNYTYTLPTASTSVLGGVKVDGTTITISGGIISGSPSVKTLSSQYTDVPNTGTTETDLMSYTIPAGQLANNGDRIVIEGEFTTASNTNAKDLKFYFGTYNQDWTSGYFGTGDRVHVKISIIRTGTATQRIVREFIGLNTQENGYSDVSITTSSTAVIKFSFTGGASNDGTQRMMNVTYFPAN